MCQTVEVIRCHPKYDNQGNDPNNVSNPAGFFTYRHQTEAPIARSITMEVLAPNRLPDTVPMM